MILSTRQQRRLACGTRRAERGCARAWLCQSGPLGEPDPIALVAGHGRGWRARRLAVPSYHQTGVSPPRRPAGRPLRGYAAPRGTTTVTRNFTLQFFGGRDAVGTVAPCQQQGARHRQPAGYVRARVLPIRAASRPSSDPERPRVIAFARRQGVCRALVVEARIRLCEHRFSTVRRSIVVLWTRNRRKYGPHRRIRRPANQSPTDSWLPCPVEIG